MAGSQDVENLATCEVIQPECRGLPIHPGIEAEKGKIEPDQLLWLWNRGGGIALTFSPVLRLYIGEVARDRLPTRHPCPMNASAARIIENVG